MKCESEIDMHLMEMVLINRYSPELNVKTPTGELSFPVNFNETWEKINIFTPTH
jgi:hypothetical protein